MDRQAATLGLTYGLTRDMALSVRVLSDSLHAGMRTGYTYYCSYARPLAVALR